MPQVNEDLLDHNLQAESGIQRNWEDEQLDIKLRDMRISESGVMTELKAESFNKEFNKITNDAFQFAVTPTFKEFEIIKQA